MRPGMYPQQHQQHAGHIPQGAPPMMFMPPGMMHGGYAPPGMMAMMPPGVMPGAPTGYDRNQQQPQQQRRQPRPPNAEGQNNAQRNNDIGDPTRVLHLRNVTPEVSQLSIQNLCQSFGRIRNIVMLRQKNQALVEMETLQSAQQIVDYFKEPGYAEIDGRRVYMRFSRHEELTATQQASKTLLVSMFNTQYDVSTAAHITPMIVYQIFGSYGPVEKIVVLPKNESSAQNYNRVQALVQFESKEAAEQVKNMLQGQPVTLGDTVTFTLDIQFSRMDDIKTSSPHNSLVVPKGATPQAMQAQYMAGGQPQGAPGAVPQQPPPQGGATW